MSTPKELAYKPKYARKPRQAPPLLRSETTRHRMDELLLDLEETIGRYRMMHRSCSANDLLRALSALRCDARNLAAASAVVTVALAQEARR